MATPLFSVLLTTVTVINAAKILTLAPLPSLSHQIIYRPIHEELIRRGHEVTFITTNPAYPNGDGPEGLREVNVGPESYDLWSRSFNVSVFGKKQFHTKGIQKIYDISPKILEMQLSLDRVKEVIEKENYDLLILQGWFRGTMVLSHLHKVPVIKMTSFTMMNDNALTVGAPDHALYHPHNAHQRVYNLTWWEQIQEVSYHLGLLYYFFSNEAWENAMLRKFYPDMPDLNELNNNVDMLFLNVHPLWDRNRPLPPNTIYIGFIHQKPAKPLPEDIQNFMDSSKNGVIYMSFGTNVPPSILPDHIKNIFFKVFSEIPYDVLWKFDKDLPNCPKNVKISKWFPQSDIFRHPNLKLIITQAGLQTVEEAINAAVPVVCIPFLGDQWLNCENFVHHGVGKMVEIETITEEMFREAVVTVIQDNGYRARMVRLRSLVSDVYQSPLQRAARYVERALSDAGRYQRSRAANMPAREYFELELLAIVVGVVFVMMVMLVVLLRCVGRRLLRLFRKS